MSADESEGMPQAMSYYAGIDPGQAGAIVLLDATSRIAEIMDWPPGEAESGILAIHEWLRYGPLLDRLEYAVIERGQVRPAREGERGQGVVSAYTFGVRVGEWRGLIVGLRTRLEMVAPQSWQAAILKGQPKTAKVKDRAWLYACQRWGIDRFSGPRGAKLYGRSDAACMAELARRRCGSGA